MEATIWDLKRGMRFILKKHPRKEMPAKFHQDPEDWFLGRVLQFFCIRHEKVMCDLDRRFSVESGENALVIIL